MIGWIIYFNTLNGRKGSKTLKAFDYLRAKHGALKAFITLTDGDSKRFSPRTHVQVVQWHPVDALCTAIWYVDARVRQWIK